MTYIDFYDVKQEIENTTNKTKIEKLIDKALLAISDEKVIYGEYDNAISKIKEVENIISKYKLKRPDFLDYIIASIDMEYLSKKEPDKFYKAEKIYKDLIGREDSSNELKNLAKYALCKFYTRNLNHFEELSNQEKEYIENFKRYFIELKSLRDSGKLDRHISRNFSELEYIYNQYDNTREKEYIVETIGSENKQQYFSLSNAIEESKISSDLLIDLENFKAYANGQDLKLSPRFLMYLYLLSNGTKNKEVIEKIGFTKAGVDQRRKDMKERLEKHNIVLQGNPTLDSSEKSFKISNKVVIKVIQNSKKEILDYFEDMHELVRAK